MQLLIVQYMHRSTYIKIENKNLHIVNENIDRIFNNIQPISIAEYITNTSNYDDLMTILMNDSSSVISSLTNDDLSVRLQIYMNICNKLKICDTHAFEHLCEIFIKNCLPNVTHNELFVDRYILENYICDHIPIINACIDANYVPRVSNDMFRKYRNYSAIDTIYNAISPENKSIIDHNVLTNTISKNALYVICDDNNDHNIQYKHHLTLRQIIFGTTYDIHSDFSNNKRLTHIMFGDGFNSTLNTDELQYLTHLIFGKMFDTTFNTLNNVMLKVLILDNNFNQELNVSNNKLLTTLHLGKLYDQKTDLSNNTLLEILHFGDNFNHQLNLANNSELTILRFGRKYNHSTDLSLNNKLMIVTFGHNLSQDIIISESVKYVTLHVKYAGNCTLLNSRTRIIKKKTTKE